MTLQEHAKKIWNNCTTPIHNCFEGLADTHRVPLYERAYDELRKELFDYKTHMHAAFCRISDSLGMEGALWSKIADKAVAAIKSADELRVEVNEKSEAIEELETWTNRYQSDLHRMADALGLKKDKMTYSEIADAAVEAIKVAKHPQPHKKAVYEWRGDTLFRGDEEVGRVILAHKHPTHVWRWIVAFACRSLIDGQSNGSVVLAQAAVEAIVRAHYGDEA